MKTPLIQLLQQQMLDKEAIDQFFTDEEKLALIDEDFNAKWLEYSIWSKRLKPFGEEISEEEVGEGCMVLDHLLRKYAELAVIYSYITYRFNVTTEMVEKLHRIFKKV